MYSTILHKRSSEAGRVPYHAALSAGEIAINIADGTLFTKITGGSVKTFLNSDNNSYILNQSLSSTTFQYGNNTVTEILASVLGGVDNTVSGGGSTIVNGSDNRIDADYAIIGNGVNNYIASTGDYGAIIGGVNNTLSHSNSFILGSNIVTHLENFTYTNNLSVLSGSSVGGDLQVDGNAELGFSQGQTSLYVTNQLVGINTESPNEALTVVGNISASGNIKLRSTSSAPTNSSNPVAWADIYVNSVLYKMLLVKILNTKAKVIGGKVLVVVGAFVQWILENGFWNDQGKWKDYSDWKD
jgi:hypothetical protein